MSNYPTAVIMREKIQRNFFNFMSEFLESCDIPTELAELPLKFNNPHFDTNDLPNFQVFITPGITIFIVFFLAIVLMGDAFIEEKTVSVLLFDREHVLRKRS